MTNQKTPVQGGATKEQIEAGARALFEESQELDQNNSWDDALPDEWRETWLYMAEECIVAALSASASAHPAVEHHDADGEDLNSAFEQMREEYDGYRHAVRAGVQRVRDVAARTYAAPEVLESLAYVGVPPALVPAQTADEHHDAEERQAESEDHAATVTGDREELIAELRDEAKAARKATVPDPEGYGMICRWEADEDLLDRAADALAAPVEVDEAKLAEVIAESFYQRRPLEPIAASAARRAIERKDEWLRGEGK